MSVFHTSVAHTGPISQNIVALGFATRSAWHLIIMTTTPVVEAGPQAPRVSGPHGGVRLEKHRDPVNFEELVLRAINAQTLILQELANELQGISRQLAKIALNTTPIAVKSFVVNQTSPL